MHWHVITGSKGGIGKTLLTLLLLEYHLEKKPKEGVLVLDLNATNADTSAMLQYNKTVGKPIIVGKKDGPGKMTLQKVFSSDGNHPRHFVVGWPENPFALCGTNQFPLLLSSVKQSASEIAEKTKLPPLQHVIIDTNYHFCNLFPEMDEHYEIYTTGELKDDNVTIWFLWVYRQLDRFLKRENQAELMTATASAIERLLKKGGIGPIVHTYTPVGLLPVEPGQRGWFSRIFGGDNATDTVRRDKDHDHSIPKLLELEKLPVGKYLEFGDWLDKLKVSHVNNVGRGRNEDPHLLFVNVLDEAIRQLEEEEEEGDAYLPVNIFPLSVYQSALEGYTDKDKADIVAALRKITLYKNFEKLLDSKLDSKHENILLRGR